VSGRAVFDLVRERLGAGVGLLNLAASFFITLLTLAAEIGGVALSLQLATSVNYLLFVPVVGFLIWLVCWRVGFELMDNAVGLLGLALIVVAVAVWQAHPDWGGMLRGAIHPVVPATESHATYWYFAIALLGSAMTPYEVFFFSSGAVEQRWTRSDLPVNRMNVYIGFPLGGLLALALMLAAALVLEPRGIDPNHLSQAALPTSLVLGKLGLALALRASSPAPWGPPWRRCCRAATPSRSTSAGSGASSSSRSRRPASSWSCWSRSRSAPVWC
jgi:Mn2+/Fe2+ NRAMP family transporter